MKKKTIKDKEKLIGKKYRQVAKIVDMWLYDKINADEAMSRIVDVTMGE